MTEALNHLYLVIKNLHNDKFSLREINVAEATLEDMRKTLTEAKANGYLGGLIMELEGKGVTKEEQVSDIWAIFRYPEDMNSGPPIRGTN